MYPNARVDGNPGGADWKSKLPEALKNKIPEGADNFYKDGDVYIFTKGGAVISGGKYKADGSVFTASSSSSSNMPALDNNQITQGMMQQGGSIFNFGAGTGVDLNSSFMGGNYNINTNKLMGSAGLLGAASMLASEAPLGLGGLLGSLAMPGIMAGFMKSLSFNFDFSNMFTSSQAGTGTGTGTLPEGFEQTALAGVYKKDGKFYKKDDNGNWLQCDDTGKIKDEAKLPTGYEKTATEGIYKKGEEYIKYDAETRTYVACDKDGNKIEAPAEKKTEQSDAKAETVDAKKTVVTAEKPEQPTTTGDAGSSNRTKTSGKVKTNTAKATASAEKSDAPSAASAKKTSTPATKKTADPRPNFLNYTQFTNNKANLSTGVKSDTKNPDGSRTVVLENGQRAEFDSKGRLTRRLDGTILKYNGDETRPSSVIKSKTTSYTHTSTYGAAYTSTTTHTETTTYKKTNATKVSYSAQKQDWDKRGIKYSYKQDPKTGNYTLTGPTTTVTYDKNGKYISETRKNRDGSTTSISYKNGYEVRTTKTNKCS